MAEQLDNRNTAAVPSVFPTNSIRTMSSREIAELVGSRHDKVKQSIERLAERKVIVQPPMGDEPESDAIGRQRVTKVYLVGKRDSYVIVAQLCPEFTARLVDRWQELEAQHRPDPIATLSDPNALRGLLLTYSEKVIALEAANSELTPKAEALERIATADGSLNVTGAAKALQMRPKDLFAYLQAHHWIYRRPGSQGYLGYQAKVTTGLIEHKVTTVLRADGSEKIVEQVLITAKGLTKLAALISPVAIAA